MYQKSLLGGGGDPFEIFLKMHKVFARFYATYGQTIATSFGRTAAYLLVGTTSAYTNINLLTGEIGDVLTTGWYMSDTNLSASSYLPTALTDSDITFPKMSDRHDSEMGLWYLTADELTLL